MTHETKDQGLVEIPAIQVKMNILGQKLDMLEEICDVFAIRLGPVLGVEPAMAEMVETDEPKANEMDSPLSEKLGSYILQVFDRVEQLTDILHRLQI